MTEYFTQRTRFERGMERQNEPAAWPPLSAAAMIQTFLAQVSGEQGVFRWVSSAKNTTSLEIGTPNFLENRIYFKSCKKQIIFSESRGRHRFLFSLFSFSPFFRIQSYWLEKILYVRDAPLRRWRVDSMLADVGNLSLLKSAHFHCAHWMVHTLFWVRLDSCVNRFSFTSTLSWVSLRQPVSENFLLFSQNV